MLTTEAEIERLGTLAARFDVEAQKFPAGSWERGFIAGRSSHYRECQTKLLTQMYEEQIAAKQVNIVIPAPNSLPMRIACWLVLGSAALLVILLVCDLCS